MNNRSLTRGDIIVIGAAALLLIASFLDFYSFKSALGGDSDSRNAWSNFWFPALFSIYLAGVIAAGLTAGARFVPESLKPLGLRLDQWGLALAIFVAWTAIWTLFANPLGAKEALDMGVGQILGAIFAVILAVGAVLNQVLPQLKLPISGGAGNKPGGFNAYGQQPQPQQGYGYPGAQQQPGMQQPQGGYGYPGAQQQPYGQQAQQPQQAQQQPQQAAQPQAGGAPDPNFQPFWFAVPVARPLFAEDGSQTPVAELAPGTWYLAVEQRGQALVAQTQDNRRGILQDTSGIQRG